MRAALVALALICAGCGAVRSAVPASAPACTAIARRVYAQAEHGRAVAGATTRLEHARALDAAIARGDVRAARRALRPVMRAQIKRIVIARHGRPFLTVGPTAVIAPVRVGDATFSVMTTAQYVELVRAITGAPVDARTRACPGRVALTIIARRVYAAEHGGAHARAVARHVARDPRFAAAVAHDDPAALRARIVHFFRDPRLHVVRIRATRGGRLVNDVGGPYVLAPVSRPVRFDGHIVGRVTVSIQDDAGYIKLLRRLAGVGVRLRTSAGVVPGSARGGRPLATLPVGAFPTGRLRVTLVACPRRSATSPRSPRAGTGCGGATAAARPASHGRSRAA